MVASFSQECETYKIVAAHGYFDRLIIQLAEFKNGRALHFSLDAFPIVTVWVTSVGRAPRAGRWGGRHWTRSPRSL